MAGTRNSTPRADGFIMPGEYDPHEKTWMLWPERGDNWRLKANPAQIAFTSVAIAISKFEPLSMGVSAGQYRNARSMLPERVRVVEISSNDSWMRDVGPTFVVNGRGEVCGVDWVFNAWGGMDEGLYYPWNLDDAVAQKVLEVEGFERYRAPLILEGGSIHVDGEGTLITTEECLLNPNRNPELSRKQIEKLLREYTGADKIIWLQKGVYNDETNGHIDNLCCFLQPGLVALTWTEDHNDPQYPISQDAWERLTKTVDAEGREIEVLKLLQPEPILITEEEAEGVEAVEGTIPRQAGDRMAASYVNFYLCNRGAVMPTFDDPHDQIALTALQKALPDRKVVGVPAREILLGGGNIHCITQQQPCARRAG